MELLLGYEAFTSYRANRRTRARISRQADWSDSRTDERRRRAPVPVEFDNGPLAVCCCPQAIRPGVARFLSRVVGYAGGHAYRAVLTSAGLVACPATRPILEFSGVCCAPGEPSLVAEASGVNSLKAMSGLRHASVPRRCHWQTNCVPLPAARVGGRLAMSVPAIPLVRVQARARAGTISKASKV